MGEGFSEDSVGLIQAGRAGRAGAAFAFEVEGRSVREEAGEMESGITGESEEGEDGSTDIEYKGFELSEGAVRERLLNDRSGIAEVAESAVGGSTLLRVVSSSRSASSFSFFSRSLDSALFVNISRSFAAEISSC
jgi:hypothetical protein